MTSPSAPSLAHIRFEGRPTPRVRHAASRAVVVERLSQLLPRTVTEDEPLDAFITWVLDRAGLAAGAYRVVSLHRRLAACLRALQAPSVAAARRRLTQQPNLLPVAVNALLIGVTDFWRDADVFETLQAMAAGELAQRRGPIRVWSAACANGSELYSMAMLLAEAGLLQRSVLIGTDCRPDAIREAAAGRYSREGIRQLPAALRAKYLVPADGLWRVADPLRRAVQWRARDLLAGVEAGPWDIVLWRNAAIYLKPEPAVAIWDALAGTLRPGGVLVVGKAERPPRAAGLMGIGRCVYRVQGAPPKLIHCPLNMSRKME